MLSALSHDTNAWTSHYLHAVHCQARKCCGRPSNCLQYSQTPFQTTHNLLLVFLAEAEVAEGLLWAGLLVLQAAQPPWVGVGAEQLPVAAPYPSPASTAEQH